MCVIEMKGFLILSILWGWGRSESVPPKILLGNGTAVRHDDLIYIFYGDPLELYCAGEGYELQMTAETLMTDEIPKHKIDTISINETTIRFFDEKPETGIFCYECKFKKRLPTPQDYTAIAVVVDSPPAVENFRCKSMNYEYLNCSWTGRGYGYENLLYYVRDEIPTLLCKTYSFRAYCVWNPNQLALLYEVSAENFTIYMTTCNLHVGCTNQTFQFDHQTIVKLNAPELTLLQSSYGVSLLWKINFVSNFKLSCEHIYLEQKITYRYSRYSGIPQYQAVNLSIEKNYLVSGLGKIELKLPCANELYEVRVSVRPQMAVGEEFWSEDAVITFATEATLEGARAADDPTCNQPRANITKDVMLYKIEQLMEQTKREQNELKIKINAMRLKAYYINI